MGSSKIKLDSLLRPQVQLLARQCATEGVMSPSVKRAINSIEIIQRATDEFEIDADSELWESLSKADQLKDFDEEIENLADQLNVEYLRRVPADIVRGQREWGKISCSRDSLCVTYIYKGMKKPAKCGLFWHFSLIYQ